MSEYNWLSDDDYAKARGQARLALNEIMGVFNVYGMEIYIHGAIAEIMQVIDAYGDRVRGKDVPIMVKRSYNPDD